MSVAQAFILLNLSGIKDIVLILSSIIKEYNIEGFCDLAIKVNCLYLSHVKRTALGKVSNVQYIYFKRRIVTSLW